MDSHFLNKLLKEEKEQLKEIDKKVPKNKNGESNKAYNSGCRTFREDRIGLLKELIKICKEEENKILENNPINEIIEKAIFLNDIQKETTIEWLLMKLKARRNIKNDLIFINGEDCEMFKRIDIEIALLDNLINEIKGE